MKKYYYNMTIFNVNIFNNFNNKNDFFLINLFIFKAENCGARRIHTSSFHNRQYKRLADTQEKPQSVVIGWLRCRLNFAVLALPSCACSLFQTSSPCTEPDLGIVQRPDTA